MIEITTIMHHTAVHHHQPPGPHTPPRDPLQAPPPPGMCHAICVLEMAYKHDRSLSIFYLCILIESVFSKKSSLNE